MITKESESTLRKTRTKLRKPKFLSLRLQLFSCAAPPPPPMHATTHNLFPLHPENNNGGDKSDDEHDMAACMFSSCDDAGAATTLTGILCSDDDETEENTNNPSPSSVNYADDDVDLVRTAMRRNKGENDDVLGDRESETWVCYSEVVERKNAIRGLSSSSSSTSCNRDYEDPNRGSKLVLKLDYEKIMKSWVNKGSLYVHEEDPGLDPGLPQMVPDLRDDDFFQPSWINPINGFSRDERDNSSNGGLWTVPEMTFGENNDTGRGEEPTQTTTSAMIHNREASVQRYKEKRRNRLFAKTIRYEVRKLNAEKRPRIKGRFVKRN